MSLEISKSILFATTSLVHNETQLVIHDAIVNIEGNILFKTLCNTGITQQLNTTFINNCIIDLNKI